MTKFCFAIIFTVLTVQLSAQKDSTDYAIDDSVYLEDKEIFYLAITQEDGYNINDLSTYELIGPQLASVIGGFPAATQVQSTPPPSTTQQLLGLGIGAAGLGGAVRSFFPTRQ